MAGDPFDVGPEVVRVGSRAVVKLPVIEIGYDVTEFDDWTTCLCEKRSETQHPGPCVLPLSAARDAKHAALQKFCNADGMLFGRPVSVYWHQVHNWPEFALGRVLAERGFSPDDIIYEVWNASSEASAFIKATAGDTADTCARGTAVLMTRLPESVFADFAALVEANKKQLIHRADPHEANVDIFAARAEEVCFYEAKRDGEGVLDHQDLVLALLAFALESRWQDQGTKPRVRTSIVRFVADLPVGEVRMGKPHELLIELPGAW